MVETALEHVRILEKLDYRQMKLSIKATEVPLMVEAYRKLSDKIPYPLHLGVTEAGTIKQGTINLLWVLVLYFSMVLVIPYEYL